MKDYVYTSSIYLLIVEPQGDMDNNKSRRQNKAKSSAAIPISIIVSPKYCKLIVYLIVLYLS